MDSMFATLVKWRITTAKVRISPSASRILHRAYVSEEHISNSLWLLGKCCVLFGPSTLGFKKAGSDMLTLVYDS